MQTKNTSAIKSTMNLEMVVKSIGYHGQPLQKIWEGEHGDHNLISLGITNPDYSVYQKRQKHFAFQDRAKRLKLHLFIAKKAKELFTKDSTNHELARSNRINEFDGSSHTNANGEYIKLDTCLRWLGSSHRQTKCITSHCVWFHPVCVSIHVCIFFRRFVCRDATIERILTGKN